MKYYFKKQNQKYYEILTINECIEKLSIIIGCNIWMICLELNWFFYDPSWTFQFSEFLWTVCASAWVVFNNFLFIDATDRSKISSDEKCLFFAFNVLWTPPFKIPRLCVPEVLKNFMKSKATVGPIKMQYRKTKLQ